MRIEPVPGVGLGTAPAVQDFLAGRGPVMARFPYNHGDPGAFAARLRHLRERWDGDRGALAAALAGYNEQIGAGPAAVANANRLARPDAVAVVTGQQAGVATGPLYTVFKAMTAVQLARQQEQSLGVPVVPVFWIAAEDHDFQEIAPVHLPAGDGWTRLVLGGAPERRTSVGHIPMSEHTAALLDQLAAALPATEFRPGIVGLLQAAAAAATDLGDWFARSMAALFAGSGLVFVSAMLPAVRRLQAPFFCRLVDHHEDVDAALAAGIAAWQAAGYAPTVERHPGSLNLFHYVAGERAPLAGSGDRVWVRDRPEQAWARADIRALAQHAPHLFSTNVVTRIVSQGYVLPDLAYLAGPGEIQYIGLYTEVFQALGRAMPVVYPRSSLTLVEPALARYLEKQDLSPAQVFGGLEGKRQEVLAAADTLGLDRLFGDFRADFAARYGALAQAVLRLDPGLAPVAEENKRQIDRQLERLAEKARQAHRKQNDVALRQLDRLSQHLCPQGKLQERVANVAYFLAKYGPDLVLRLLAAAPLPSPWTHLAAYL